MSDDPITSPSQLAELIEDDRKFRTYVVLSLQSHFADDKRQFSEIRSLLSSTTKTANTAKSSVNELQGDKKTVLGAKWMAVAIGGGILIVINIGIAVASLFK